MINRLTHNWMLKLTALVLSIALWSHVRGQVNPWETAMFKVRLRAAAPRGFVLQNASSLPKTVVVTLRGPRLTLRGLKGAAPANPLAPGEVVTLATRQVRAFLDVSRPRKGEQAAVVKAETDLDDLEVVGAKPGEVEVVLDAVSQRDFPIALDLKAPEDIGFERQMLSVKTTRVLGASKALSRVAKVRASADVLRARPGALQLARVPLIALDESGEVVSGVRLEPATISVTVTARERLLEKTVPVRARITGTPAAGYVIQDIETEPSRVTVRGPRRALEDVNEVRIEADVGGARETMRRSRYTPPRGTEFVSVGRVRVRVRIAPEARESEESAPAAPRGETEETSSQSPSGSNRSQSTRSERSRGETLPPPAVDGVRP